METQPSSRSELAEPAAEPQTAPKYMACTRCPRYDEAARHCRDGKANPRRKQDALGVVEALGLRALCHYSLFRDGLALRLHFPRSGAAIASVRLPRRPKPRRTRPNGVIPKALW